MTDTPTCRICGNPLTTYRDCRRCDGRGEIEDDGDGIGDEWRSCPECGGTGEVEVCQDCAEE